MTGRGSLQGRPLAWHGLAWGLLTTIGALLYVASFKSWGDPIIDLGRDLYLPSQILEGRALYRDLLYNYGPAAPYLLTAVVAAFGDNLWVFEACGLLIGLASLVALYGIGHRLAGIAAGFSTALLFLLLNVFAASTWGCNFVLPYSFAATLGTACSLGSFYFLLRYLEGGRSSNSLAWSVLLLWSAVFCKLEVGFGIAAVHGLAWWAYRVPRRAILGVLGGSVVLGLLFVATFAARGPDEHALFGENLTKFAGGDDSTAFFELVAGLDQPGPHLLRALQSAGLLGLLIVLAGFGGLAPGLLKQRRHARAALAMLALIAGAGLIWSSAEVRLFQATPLLALCVVGYCLLLSREDPLLLCGAFALFAGLRVVLQFHPMWYGFYLVAPAYPFLVYLLGVRVAKRLPSRRTVVLAVAALALLLTWRFESTMARAYRDKTSVLATAKGSMRDLPDGRIETIAAFLDYAETQLAPREPTMVVMPEGVSLNYFTGIPNPTAYYLFTPPEIGSPEVEGRMIRELETTRPDYLVMTSRDLAEYGRRGIGLDYAIDLGDWIRSSYELEKIFEAPGDRPWRLLLLRRHPT